MHDYRSQREDTFETFRQVGRGMKLPKTAVVVYQFVAEELGTDWAGVQKELRAKGFRTSHDEDVLEARIGPIAIEPEAIWEYERMATEIALPFAFEPDGWELDG